MSQSNLPAKAEKPKTELAKLNQYLDTKRDDIKRIIPPSLSVERVIKTAMLAAMDNPTIGLECTQHSIYRSILQACLMGLTVGSGFNEGYLIPYYDKDARRKICTFSASYIGWAKVATRSEGVDLIRASVVYSNDELRIHEHPPSAVHEAKWKGGQRGECIGALACAYTIVGDGHRLYDFQFVPVDDLNKARAQADAKRASPAWAKWTDEMRKKVAIRRLCKLLPRNEQLSRLTRIENNTDGGLIDVPDPDVDNLNEMIQDARFEDAPAAEPASGTRSQQLKGRMGVESKPPEEPDYGPPPVEGEEQF